MECQCFFHLDARNAACEEYVDLYFSTKVPDECEVGTPHFKYNKDEFKAYSIAYTRQCFTEDDLKYDDEYVGAQCDLQWSANHL